MGGDSERKSTTHEQKETQKLEKIFSACALSEQFLLNGLHLGDRHPVLIIHPPHFDFNIAGTNAET